MSSELIFIVVVTLSSACDTSDAAGRSLVRPTGAITLVSPNGVPVGFVHAETLTAFRTALASTCLVAKRGHVRTLTVFGSGLQAFWHIRLALMLRGSSIKTVNIINRRFSENARLILKRFYGIPTAVKQREGWESTAFGVLTPGYGEFDRLQREQIRNADVIYCCTPSTEALFDASILTNHEGRRKGRLIIAVGSYTPSSFAAAFSFRGTRANGISEMKELPRELLLQATKQYDKSHRHFHKHAPEGGVIVVDTLDGALSEAGEIIDAGIKPTQLIEYVGLGN
jgi:ornithine cyclodeaminase/alanine dehydrogenase-like protein (mu-crystallin family)